MHVLSTKQFSVWWSSVRGNCTMYRGQSATRLRVLNLVTTFFKLGVVKARLGDVSKRPWVRQIRADGIADGQIECTCYNMH